MRQIRVTFEIDEDGNRPLSIKGGTALETAIVENIFINEFKKGEYAGQRDAIKKLLVNFGKLADML